MADSAKDVSSVLQSICVRLREDSGEIKCLSPLTNASCSEMFQQ